MAVSDENRIPAALKWQRGAWMLAGSLGILAVLFLILFPLRKDAAAKAAPELVRREPSQAVWVQADGTIRISTDTPFIERIQTVRLEQERITDPLLTVSGIVVAKVLPGGDDDSEKWYFDSPDLAATHASWHKTLSEIEFSRSILEKTQELAKAEVNFHTELLQRLEENAKSGVVPERELRSARAELMKAQIQGQREVFAAQSAWRAAKNTRFALERELSQRGIEPVVFDRGVDNMVLVSANVPEAKVSQVREGQACRVRFYAYPEKLFDGHVETLSTTVTKELRTLRVLFDLSDPDGRLIPGMFAEVELGTEERDALVVPAAAILHVGQADYVLAEASSGVWQPSEVRVGEFHHGTFEVLHGLTAGQTIISEGAILLKPKLVESLSRTASVR